MSGYVWRDPVRANRPLRRAAFTLMLLTPEQNARLTPAERTARSSHQRRTVEALAALHDRQYNQPGRVEELEEEARGWSKRARTA